MRKTYDREFKLKISQDLLEKKVTTKKIAEEYNISRPTISRWVSEYRRYRNNAFAGQGKRLPDKADFYILEQENKRLTEENEILKMVVRFEFVHKHHQQYSIQTLCRILNVSRQGYYLWRNRRPSRTQLRHNFLKQNIKGVFYEHKGRYGYPRIAQQLYDEGIETNKRVASVLMCGMNLCAKGFYRRQSSYGRGKAIEEIVKENLLSRQFEQSQDLTGIVTSNFIVLGLFSVPLNR